MGTLVLFGYCKESTPPTGEGCCSMKWIQACLDNVHNNAFSKDFANYILRLLQLENRPGNRFRDRHQYSGVVFHWKVNKQGSESPEITLKLKSRLFKHISKLKLLEGAETAPEANLIARFSYAEVNNNTIGGNFGRVNAALEKEVYYEDTFISKKCTASTIVDMTGKAISTKGAKDFVKKWNECGSWILRVKMEIKIPEEVVPVKATASENYVIGKNILEDKENCDVKVVTKEGLETLCHKMFLVAASPVFAAMLREGGFQESINHKVNLQDVTKKEFQAFLQFIYYGEKLAPLGSCGIALKLLEMGEQYDVKSLREAMEGILIKKEAKWFTADVAIKLFLFARNIPGGEGLVEKAISSLRSKSDGEIMNCERYTEAVLTREFFNMMKKDRTHVPVKRSLGHLLCSIV